MKSDGDTIDINCDMGEGFPYDMELMDCISSANIACAGHAGSREMMKRSIAAAMEKGVATGAHPGYPDRDNFGRVESGYSNEDILEIVTDQIGLFLESINDMGGKISHIKLHGALYNRAASDYNLMTDLVRGIVRVFGPLPIYTLSGSLSESAVRNAGGILVREAFPDRAYNMDGSLVSRQFEGSVISDCKIAAKRALDIVMKNSLVSITNKNILMKADSICIHGDSTGALETAGCIWNTMIRGGFRIAGKF